MNSYYSKKESILCNCPKKTSDERHSTPSICIDGSKQETHFPIVKNKRSPTSPNPGTIIPFSLTPSSIPATQISTPSGHSLAALTTPGTAPNTAITITRCTPHSFSVWMAAEQVPPVAMTGSSRMARLEAEELGLLEGVFWAGRW